MEGKKGGMLVTGSLGEWGKGGQHLRPEGYTLATATHSFVLMRQDLLGMYHIFIVELVTLIQ